MMVGDLGFPTDRRAGGEGRAKKGFIPSRGSAERQEGRGARRTRAGRGLGGGGQ